MLSQEQQLIALNERNRQLKEQLGDTYKKVQDLANSQGAPGSNVTAVTGANPAIASDTPGGALTTTPAAALPKAGGALLPPPAQFTPAAAGTPGQENYTGSSLSQTPPMAPAPVVTQPPPAAVNPALQLGALQPSVVLPPQQDIG